jgi:hypothetical protein
MPYPDCSPGHPRMGYWRERLAIRRDSLNWPQEGGLKWPHLRGRGVSL